MDYHADGNIYKLRRDLNSQDTRQIQKWCKGSNVYLFNFKAYDNADIIEWSLCNPDIELSNEKHFLYYLVEDMEFMRI